MPLSELPFNVMLWRRQRPRPLHDHDYHELVIVTGGTGVHLLESSEYPLTKGDVFMILPGVLHGYRDTQNLGLFNLLHYFDRLGFPMNDIADLPGYQQLYVNPPSISGPNLRLGPGQLTAVQERCRSVWREMHFPGPGWQSASLLGFAQILLQVMQCFSAEEAGRARAKRRLARVLLFVERNYSEPITLKTLMRVANMSSSSLNRHFRKAVKMSPLQYVDEVRVQQSAALLTATDMAVTDIAYACGFQDSSYYAKRFRQRMGISPSAFRTNM